MPVRATRKDASKFFLEGTIALAKMEHNGLRVNRKYLEKTMKETEATIKSNFKKMKEDKFYKEWYRMFGAKTNIDSVQQIGKLLTKQGYKTRFKTEKGNDQWNEEALSHIDLPFLKAYNENRKLKKAHGTYLTGILRETDSDGFLHPSYNLAGRGDENAGSAKSYRSTCIAEGTLIEIVRDIEKYPKGVPIEDVKKGDLVYCYNNKRRLTLRKVLWSGKTGHRKVIRLHWLAARGRRGYVDLTPEHRVRLTTGKYKRADELKPGERVLALTRNKDKIYETFPDSIEGEWDHRFVYRKRVGPLKRDEIVHHKDENHWNNVPTNLEKMTQSKHAKLHDSFTDEGRAKAVISRMKNDRDGKIIRKIGHKHPSWLSMSKYQLLRILAKLRGRVTQVQKQNIMDFNTFKNKAIFLGVNIKEVADRYDWQGGYITKNRVMRAAAKGIKEFKIEFGCNHYKAYRIAKKFGCEIKQTRTYNHRITRIEKLNIKKDVYDITVEGCHNFIAGELCVHNSADPNFQNWPIRNPVMSKLIRPSIISRKGMLGSETDFGQIEVRVSACYNFDPVLIKYIKDSSTDMHKDMACEIFMLKPDQVTKKGTRDASKNIFVFPEFYGSYYVDVSRNLWEAMLRRKFTIEGSDKLVIDHLREKGITKLGKCDPEQKPKKGTFEHHIAKVEDDFWNKRFKVYTEWKKKTYSQYLKTGYIDMHTGFRCEGIYRRNQVLNLAIQGSAFHCLLWSIIQVQKWIDKYKMKTVLTGQIHDCFLADSPPNELQDFLDVCREIMTEKIRKAWSWIIVPLETEVDIFDEKTTWLGKSPWVKKDEIWQAKA